MLSLLFDHDWNFRGWYAKLRYTKLNNLGWQKLGRYKGSSNNLAFLLIDYISNDWLIYWYSYHLIINYAMDQSLRSSYQCIRFIQMFGGDNGYNGHKIKLNNYYKIFRI